MNLFWGSIAVALFLVWVLTIGDIIRRRMDAKHTAAWLLLVLVVPFLGSIIYAILRKPREDELQRQIDNENALRGHRETDLRPGLRP